MGEQEKKENKPHAFCHTWSAVGGDRYRRRKTLIEREGTSRKEGTREAVGEKYTVQNELCECKCRHGIQYPVCEHYTLQSKANQEGRQVPRERRVRCGLLRLGEQEPWVPASRGLGEVVWQLAKGKQWDTRLCHHRDQTTFSNAENEQSLGI